jgi:hypothetical protein
MPADGMSAAAEIEKGRLRALADYDEAIRLDPKDAQSFTSRGAGSKVLLMPILRPLSHAR